MIVPMNKFMLEQNGI